MSRRPRRPRRQWPALVLAALAGAAVAGVVGYALRPVSPPPASPAATPVPPGSPGGQPALSRPPAPPPAATGPTLRAASRSRGRTDWLFFFGPGDRLTRMSDDVPVGMVLRTEPAHTFPDGTLGPAYLLQVPDGGQRFMDADELERTSRLQ